MNDVIFNGKGASLTMKFIHKKVLEISQAFPRITRREGSRRETQIGWQPPVSNWCKINTDRAAKGYPTWISCGGILRDSIGEWISGFGANLGVGTVNEAELWALYYGLQLAWNEGQRRVIVEMDSQIILGWIKQEPSQAHSLRVLIHCCRQYITRD